MVIWTRKLGRIECDNSEKLRSLQQEITESNCKGQAEAQFLLQNLFKELHSNKSYNAQRNKPTRCYLLLKFSQLEKLGRKHDNYIDK